jgi:hypothetical protein
MKDKITQGKYLDDFPQVFTAIQVHNSESLALKADLNQQQFEVMKLYAQGKQFSEISEITGVKRCNIYAMLAVGTLKILSLLNKS